MSRLHKTKHSVIGNRHYGKAKTEKTLSNLVSGIKCKHKVKTQFSSENIIEFVDELNSKMNLLSNNKKEFTILNIGNLNNLKLLW